jgi:hypothetical protein
MPSEQSADLVAAKGTKMGSKITDAVIEAMQHCRLKAHFLLRGEEGIQSSYEKLLIEQRANMKPKAIEKIRYEYRNIEVATDLDLSLANLREGTPFILNARLENDSHSVLFDGLRKIDGSSTSISRLNPKKASLI